MGVGISSGYQSWLVFSEGRQVIVLNYGKASWAMPKIGVSSNSIKKL